MIALCEYSRLKVFKETKHGYFLEDGDGDEVLLPFRSAPEDLELDSRIEVFTYLDSQNRMIATTKSPKVNLYQFAVLKCIEVAPFGAFMDWGLERDLLVPNSEMATEIEPGSYCITYLYLDNDDRPTGTTQVERILDRTNIELQEKEEVDLLIWEETRLGFKVIINHLYEGLIYHNEIFKNVFEGKPMKGYVKKIREDNRIDVSLEPIGYKRVVSNHNDKVLTALEDAGGFLPLHDKSNPEDIKEQLKMSKKAFKKAIGALYKQRMISIEDDGIRLVK